MVNTRIIQGGMGIGVSGWRLAKAVSLQGQLGVVSGTGIDTVMTRLLQKGDVGGHLRKAMEAFPDREISDRIYNKYFRDQSSDIGVKFLPQKLHKIKLTSEQEELLVMSNFVEVFLAKEGHDGLVGINLLEKTQLTTLPSLYGAMLAGVDYVIMGAGIPREIPGALDNFALGNDAHLRVDVTNADSEDKIFTNFSPVKFMKKFIKPLTRPKFLAIISSNVLAITLKKKATGRVDGFIVEKPSAGGHNAPPRGASKAPDAEEPVYTKKDSVNLEALKKLDLPFWLAGGYGASDGIQYALEQGAEGIQVGSLFALCEESGLKDELKKQALSKVLNSDLEIKTDAKASPTGFPFKVAQLEGTYSDDELCKKRSRLCDVGYLRKPFKKMDGSIGYRCPSEPVEKYVAKGGKAEETLGRKCLCNALLANLDLAQTQSNLYEEKPLVTLGDDTSFLKKLISQNQLRYTAKDVIDSLSL